MATETYGKRALAARFAALLMERQEGIADKDAVDRGLAIADRLIGATPTETKTPSKRASRDSLYGAGDD